MSRAALLVLAVSLIGGCKPAADDEPVDSPSDSVAGTEAKRSDRASGDGTGSTLASKPRLANSLVAVATTSASEAQPCERVCGSLGDCLLDDDSYTTVVAGGLELECLNLCVHAPDSAPIKSEFLACGAQTECGPLKSCAEQHWVALAEARRGPEIAGVVSPSADPCKNACRWMYSCIFTSTPPGDAPLDPAYEQYVTTCVDGCDQMAAAEREMMTNLGVCLVDNCSAERAGVCWETLYH